MRIFEMSEYSFVVGFVKLINWGNDIYVVGFFLLHFVLCEHKRFTKSVIVV